jgi:uncharacterized protein with ATP-grasp and redox domains
LESQVDRLLKGAVGRAIPSYYITRAHRLLKRFDPRQEKLVEQRRAANRAVKQMLNSCGRAGLAARLRWAAWANSLDFRTAGVGYEYDQFGRLRRRLGKRLHIDQTRTIVRLIKGARRILYVLDNVGEIGFDRLVIAALARGRKITCAVRGGIMTSDVTRADARYFGLDRIARVIISGPDTLGLLPGELSRSIKAALDRADLVIAKGQANYYFFSEYPNITRAPVVHLFTTKCDVVSRRFGRKGKFALALVRN